MSLPSPSCPRCGYDQTGVAESWREACPLIGRCPECGLDFAWSDLLNPVRTIPRWSFEHTLHHRVRCLLATARRAFNPGAFWRAIRLHHPIHRRRLVIFALVCPVLAHLVCAVMVAGLAAWATTTRGTPLVWSIPGSMPGPASQAQANSYVGRVIAAAALAPYGQWSMRFDEVSLARNPAWFLIIASVLMPLPFLVLSDTFRLARVRFIQLLRVWAYSQAALWTLTVLLMAIALVMSWTHAAQTPLTLVTTALVVFGFIWLVVWWWRACTLYLRLPSPGLVLAAMTIITLLASIAWMAYFQESIADGFDQLAMWLRNEL